jgi:protein TonB
MPPSAATAGFIQSLAAERALIWCVLASIVLHALVLLGLSSRGAPAPPAKALLVLTARLMPVAAVPPAPVQPAPSRLAPPHPAPPVSVPHRAPDKPAATPAPAPQKAAAVEAAQVPPPAPVAAETSAEVLPAPVAAPVQTSTANQAPARVPATDTAAKSGNDLDAGTLDQYRLALIVATSRYKRYPAIAMEKGWQGKVEVRMVIGANGSIASASIKSGSGHEVLDNQALDMLKKGNTTVPIPASLRGREFSIEIPVIFNLENPNS